MTETYLLQRSADSTAEIPVMFSSFVDGDTHCVIEDTEHLTREPVLIVHLLYPNQNEQLIRLMLLIDLLHDLGVTEVSVFCPYLPYSRQDKRHIPGEALGAYAVCRMLAAAGCVRLYTIDCHFMRGHTEGTYKGLTIVNIPATEQLVKICHKTYLDNTTFHVVGPDKGASLLAGTIDHHMHKTRGNYGTSGPSARDVTGMSSDHISLTHQATLIVDDMVSTGGTMLRAIEELRQKGCEQVYCVCTHGLFIGDSFEKLSNATDGIIVGDTVPHPSAKPIMKNILQQNVVPHWL